MGYQDDWNEITSDPQWDGLDPSMKAGLTRFFAKQMVKPQAKPDEFKQFIQNNIINKTTTGSTQAPQGTFQPVQGLGGVWDAFTGGMNDEVKNGLTGSSLKAAAKMAGHPGFAQRFDQAVTGGQTTLPQDKLTSVADAAGRFTYDMLDPIGAGIAKVAGAFIPHQAASALPAGVPVVNPTEFLSPAERLAMGAIDAVPNVARAVGRGALTGGAQGVVGAATQGYANGDVDWGQVGREGLAGAALGMAMEAPHAFLPNRAAAPTPEQAAANPIAKPAGLGLDLETPAAVEDVISPEQQAAAAQQAQGPLLLPPGNPDTPIQMGGEPGEFQAPAPAGPRMRAADVPNFRRINPDEASAPAPESEPAAPQGPVYALPPGSSDAAILQGEALTPEGEVQKILQGASDEQFNDLFHQALEHVRQGNVDPGIIDVLNYELKRRQALTDQPRPDMPNFKREQPEQPTPVQAPLQLPESTQVNVPPDGFRPQEARPDALTDQFQGYRDMTPQAPARAPLQIPERTTVNVPPEGFRDPNPALTRQQGQAPGASVPLPATALRPEVAKVADDLLFRHEVAANLGDRDTMGKIEQAMEQIGQHTQGAPVDFRPAAREVLGKKLELPSVEVPKEEMAKTKRKAGAVPQKGGNDLKIEGLGQSALSSSENRDMLATIRIRKEINDEIQPAFRDAVKGKDATKASQLLQLAQQVRGTYDSARATDLQQKIREVISKDPISGGVREASPVRYNALGGDANGRARETVAAGVSDAGGENLDRGPGPDMRGRTVRGAKSGHYATGVTRIQDAGDVAHLAAGLRKSAQENLVAVITDKNGNVLKVLQHTVGGIDEANAYPQLIVGHALNTPDAAHVYLAHNHPSGSAELSAPDRHLYQMAADLARGSGVSVDNILAISQTGKWGDLRQSDQPIKPMARTGQVPTVERRVQGQPLEPNPVQGPTDVMRTMSRIAPDGGIAMLDRQNRVVRIVPLPKNLEDFAALRGENQRGLLKAIEGSNASSMVVYAPRSEVSRAGLDNLRRFGRASQTDLLDVIDAKGSSRDNPINARAWRSLDHEPDRIEFNAGIHPKNFVQAWDILKEHGRAINDVSDRLLKTSIEVTKQINPAVGEALQKLAASREYAAFKADEWSRWVLDSLNDHQQQLVGRFLVHERANAIAQSLKESRDAAMRQLPAIAQALKDNDKAIGQAMEMGDRSGLAKLKAERKGLLDQQKQYTGDLTLDPSKVRVPKLSPSELAEVQRDQQIQQALSRHKELVQPEILAMRKYLGLKAMQDTGSGAFIRLKALRDGDQAVHGINMDDPSNPITGDVGAQLKKGSTSASRERLKGTNTDRAMGTGRAYETDYQALLEHSLGQDLFNFRKKQAIEAMQKEGLLTTNPDDLKAKGHDELGAVELKSPQISAKGELTGDMEIPSDVEHAGRWESTYYAPKAIAQDYKHLVQEPDRVLSGTMRDNWRKLNGAATRMQLLLPAEASKHANRVLSLLARVPVASDVKGTLLKNLVPWLGPRLQGLREITNALDPEGQQVMERLARAGGIPARSLEHLQNGSDLFSFMDKIPGLHVPKEIVFGRADVNAKGLARLSGFDIRARVAAAKLYLKVKPHATDAELADYANQFGNYCTALQSRLVKNAKEAGVTFAGFQSQAIPTEIARMVGNHGIDAAHLPAMKQAMLHAATLWSGTLGSAVAIALANYALNHKWPWQMDALKTGDVRLTDNGPDGKPLKVDLASIDPVLGRAGRWTGARAMLEAVRDDGDLNEKASQFASDFGRDTANNGLQELGPLYHRMANLLAGRDLYLTRDGSFQRIAPQTHNILTQLGANVGMTALKSNGGADAIYNALAPVVGGKATPNPSYPQDPGANAAMRLWDSVAPINFQSGSTDEESLYHRLARRAGEEQSTFRAMLRN